MANGEKVWRTSVCWTSKLYRNCPPAPNETEPTGNFIDLADAPFKYGDAVVVLTEEEYNRLRTPGEATNGE